MKVEPKQRPDCGDKSSAGQHLLQPAALLEIEANKDLLACLDTSPVLKHLALHPHRRFC